LVASPASAMRRAIGAPWLPRPTNPTRGSSGSAFARSELDGDTIGDEPVDDLAFEPDFAQAGRRVLTQRGRRQLYAHVLVAEVPEGARLFERAPFGVVVLGDEAGGA